MTIFVLDIIFRDSIVIQLFMKLRIVGAMLQ